MINLFRSAGDESDNPFVQADQVTKMHVYGFDVTKRYLVYYHPITDRTVRDIYFFIEGWERLEFLDYQGTDIELGKMVAGYLKAAGIREGKHVEVKQLENIQPEETAAQAAAKKFLDAIRRSHDEMTGMEPDAY